MIYIRIKVYQVTMMIIKEAMEEIRRISIDLLTLKLVEGKHTSYI